MTDEIKTCNCKEKCLKTLGKFALNAGAVFVGATLAILLSASILKPNCPPPMMPYPAFHRQLPPPAMHGPHGDCPYRRHLNKHNGNKQLHRQFKKQTPPPIEKKTK